MINDYQKYDYLKNMKLLATRYAETHREQTSYTPTWYLETLYTIKLVEEDLKREREGRTDA